MTGMLELELKHRLHTEHVASKGPLVSDCRHVKA